MPKYKISKKYLNEFFGLFGKPNRPKDIDNIINNDPVLQKIDKKIGDLNDKAALRLQKDADAMKVLKKLGIEIK
jgi:hypothetical protein